jgi:AraC-like DNA-binding protein
MSDECVIPWGGPIQLFNVGWFPMQKDNRRVYSDATYAVHLHHYRGTVWIGGRRFEIVPGDITVTPPHTESRYELGANGQHWCAHLNLSGDGARTLRLPLWHRTGRQAPALGQRLSWLAELARMRNGPRARLAREGLETGIRDFLLWLHLQPDVNSPVKGVRARQAVAGLVRELETHYERDVSPKQRAADVGMNANYLARIFKDTYGCTIDQFLRRRRVEVARHLLLSTGLRVKEIACMVGIADPQKFNKDFRSVEGCSPMEFRGRNDHRVVG